MKRIATKQLIIALFAAVLFIPFLGHVHLFDWDEINFAEAAREMLLTQNYMRVQIDFQPFWEKPPLFIWLQAISMAIFGVHEFAARFPNAICGIATLCTLFYAGRRIANERLAWWWVLFYAASWLPHFYFKTAIIDPTFNFFIFLAFFQIYLIRFSTRKVLHALLAGFFLGLAVLTKGPVAILIALISLGVYILLNKGIWGLGKWNLLWVVLACAVTSFSWFGIDIMQNGWWFTKTFLAYQVRLLTTGDAGHGGPFYYHFIVLLMGCFPASVFLFKKWNRSFHFPRKTKDFIRWMWILLWVVVIIFTIVRTKIVHYSSLCYFPITFLAAAHLSRMEHYPRQWQAIWRGLLLGIGTIWALVLIALPILGRHKTRLIPYIKDEFAIANLQADVGWSYWGCLIGILYLAGLIFFFLKTRKAFEQGVLGLLVLQLLVIPVTLLYFTPKIEAYSQRAAIEFYQQFRGKDVYVMPMGYKSYAHLFYTRKQNRNDVAYERQGAHWLLYGAVGKPVYFICKVTYAAELEKLPQLEKIGSKNGFVFFKRKNPEKALP